MTAKLVEAESTNSNKGLVAVHLYTPESSMSTAWSLRDDPSVSRGEPSLVHCTKGGGKPLTRQETDTLLPLIVRTVLPTTTSSDLDSTILTTSIPARMISGGAGTEDTNTERYNHLTGSSVATTLSYRCYIFF